MKNEVYKMFILYIFLQSRCKHIQQLQNKQKINLAFRIIIIFIFITEIETQLYHQFFSKIIMYRSINTPIISPYEQAQSNHKDLIIANLKRELYELKDLQNDFIKLNQQIAALQSKYALLLDQKDRNEKQHRLKMDINKKTILEMKTDIDNLKGQIHKTTVQIQETIRENNTLKRMCDNRGTEISSLMASNRQLQKDNQSRIQENKNISFNIKNLKQQKVRLQAQCERLTILLDTNVSQLKQAQKQARNLETTNTKLDNTLMQAQRDNQKLLQQLKAREISHLKTQKQLQELTQKCQDLQNKQKQLQTQCTRLENEYSTISTNLQHQSNKNKQLSTKLKTLDNTIRTTQNQLEQSILKKQNLKRQHFNLVGQNRALNTQIDKCLLDILQYEKMNAQLQKQVQNYIESDQQARNLLNRKQVMKSLLDQVNTKLIKTSDQIAHLRI